MHTFADLAPKEPSSVFAGPEFQDTSDFRKWLLDSRDSSSVEMDEHSRLYAYIYTMVQEMSQFRYQAEAYYENHRCIARTMRQELPLPQALINTKYFSWETKEPPETVITRIALQQIHVFKQIFASARKVLRRERQFSRLGSVQQLDSQCLIWLSRQPGITAAQKAGARQKMLAVVRTESYNTLENRVLKAVLKLCSSYCRKYLNAYKTEFEQNERVQSVQKLYHIVLYGLQQDFLEHVPDIHGVPQPNYVLLHDQKYSRIWHIYLDLVHQTLVMEFAWRNRHLLMREYFLFEFVNSLFFELEDADMGKNNPSLFQSYFYFSGNIRKDGSFLKNSLFHRLFCTKIQGLIQFYPPEESRYQTDCNACVLKGKNWEHQFDMYYIPEGIDRGELAFPEYQKHKTYVIFSEVGSGVQEKRGDIIWIDISKGLFYQIADWVHDFMKGNGNEV